MSSARRFGCLLVGVFFTQQLNADYYLLRSDQNQYDGNPQSRKITHASSRDSGDTIELETQTHSPSLTSNRARNRRGQLYIYSDSSGEIRASYDTEGSLLQPFEGPGLVRHAAFLDRIRTYQTRPGGTASAKLHRTEASMYTYKTVNSAAVNTGIALTSPLRTTPFSQANAFMMSSHIARWDSVTSAWIALPNTTWRIQLYTRIGLHGYVDSELEYDLDTGKNGPRVRIETNPAQESVTVRTLPYDITFDFLDAMPERDLFSIYQMVEVIGGSPGDMWVSAAVANPVSVGASDSGFAIDIQHDDPPDGVIVRACNQPLDSSRYAIDEGFVLDRYTGIEWQRCPLGYALNSANTAAIGDDTCEVSDAVLSAATDWRSALQSIPGGWRLPNVKELESLVAECLPPTIEPLVFPTTQTDAPFWTSSPVTDDTTAAAWQVNFASGEVLPAPLPNLGYVRLVRDSVETPKAPPPSVRINDMSFLEGDSGSVVHNIPVVLSRPVAEEVVLGYTFRGFDASSPGDYIAVDGQLVIPNGVTDTSISIEIVGDTTPEPNETVYLEITSSPESVRLRRALVSIQIEDDEPTLKFADTVPAASEAAGTLSIPMFLSRPLTAGQASVDYVLRPVTAMVADDYQDRSGTLFFAPDEGGGIVDVTLVDDGIVENDETFEIVLSNPVGIYLDGGRNTTELSQLVSIYDPPPTGLMALNDTAVVQCLNVNGSASSCPQGILGPQDAELGRDVQANDNSNGELGFDYTRLDQAGNDATGSTSYFINPWACVRDNTTNLVWEVKSLFINDPIEDNDLHSPRWTYTWYNSSGTKDGGGAGTQNGGECRDHNGVAATVCDTEKYIEAVNAQNWCGFNDWRLPTRQELYSIVNLANPGGLRHDEQYFPNLRLDTDTFGRTWTSSPKVRDPSQAWQLGEVGLSTAAKSQPITVRLVRGAPNLNGGSP